MKIETWHGHNIRFIEVNNEWWAVAKDVTEALGYSNHNDAIKRHVSEDDKGVAKHDTLGGVQIVNTLSEKGIYRLVMRSNKPEAVDFQNWIFEVIKELRHSNGLEGFQVFRMLDKEHQKEAMKRLYEALKTDDKEAVKFNSIKANTITNKAISIMYGLPKMISKDDMTPDMLQDRKKILDEVTNLMIMNERYNLNLSVSKTIYDNLMNSVKTA